MDTSIVQKNNNDILENLVFKGDLSGLTREQLMKYYIYLCEKFELDPLSKPFDLIQLRGGLQLYVNRNGAEQLSKRYKITEVDMQIRTEFEGFYVVISKVRDYEGREKYGIGAVPKVERSSEIRMDANIGKQYEKRVVQSEREIVDQNCNAIMKAHTKAYRRAVLSLVSLNMMDETETETITTEIVRKDEVDEIGLIDEMLKGIWFIEDYNGFIEKLKEMNLGNKKEVWKRVCDNASMCGLEFDKDSGRFVYRDEEAEKKASLVIYLKGLLNSEEQNRITEKLIKKYGRDLNRVCRNLIEMDYEMLNQLKEAWNE